MLIKKDSFAAIHNSSMKANRRRNRTVHVIVGRWRAFITTQMLMLLLRLLLCCIQHFYVSMTIFYYDILSEKKRENEM